VKKYFSFVKFGHTAFALPLILAGAMLAAGGMPEPGLVVLIVIAAAGARTCAMALNRIIDAGIDRRNPRTVARELPSGKMTGRQAWGVAIAGAIIYLSAAAGISPLCLKLSPVPLLVFGIYPYLKRFTLFTHLAVGFADAMGPAGAWVAIRSAAGEPVFAEATGLWLLVAFSVFWIAGFDVSYATLDENFDRMDGLFSLPARLGKSVALDVSGVAHFIAAVCLGLLHVSALGTPASLLVLLVIFGLLLLEHERRDDVHFAFFTANAGVSVLVFLLVAGGVLVPQAA